MLFSQQCRFFIVKILNSQFYHDPLKCISINLSTILEFRKFGLFPQKTSLQRNGGRGNLSVRISQSKHCCSWKIKRKVKKSNKDEEREREKPFKSSKGRLVLSGAVNSLCQVAQDGRRFNVRVT